MQFFLVFKRIELYLNIKLNINCLFMKNIIKVVLLLLPFSMMFSQTHRFIYEVNFKKDSLDHSLTKEYYYLDINKDANYYYNREYFVTDSVFINTGLLVAPSKTSDLLFKNNHTKEYVTITSQAFDFYKLKDLPKQDWKILAETKELNQLKLQKAQCNWAGRKWEAWFASQIPFQEGPYKFGNLPGLIVELHDQNNNFNFNLVKSENLSETYISNIFSSFLKNSNLVEIPYKKFKQMKIDYYKSPMKAAHDGRVDYQKEPIITDYGIVISTAQQLRDYEIMERKNIVKYNNPIELDKAIKYPKQ